MVQSRTRSGGTERAAMPDSRRDSTLVIGYGNTLRRDDALGCLIADKVRCWQRSGVRSMSLPQLTPELAAELAAAGTAVFVDARNCSLSSQTGVHVEPVLPRDNDWASLVHALTPSFLLKLCQAAFGHCPMAWRGLRSRLEFLVRRGTLRHGRPGYGASPRNDRNPASPRRSLRT